MTDIDYNRIEQPKPTITIPDYNTKKGDAKSDDEIIRILKKENNDIVDKLAGILEQLHFYEDKAALWLKTAKEIKDIYESETGKQLSHFPEYYKLADLM